MDYETHSKELSGCVADAQALLSRCELLPPGREVALARTHLEDAVFRLRRASSQAFGEHVRAKEAAADAAEEH